MVLQDLQKERGILLSDMISIFIVSCLDFLTFSTFLPECWGTMALLYWAPCPPEPIHATTEGFAFLCTINLVYQLSEKPLAG